MKRVLPWIFLWTATLAAAPDPVPKLPGDEFHPPTRPAASGVPLVFEHSSEAGPDETFLLVGENLTTNVMVWGASARSSEGQLWPARVLFLTNGYLTAVLPDDAADGLFLVWVKNAAGYSAPVVLNQPCPWWCGPDAAAPGETVRVFGRNLSRRPDHVQAFVYLNQPGRAGFWAEVAQGGKYAVTFRLPAAVAAGVYDVWVHAGAGGEWGWSEPVRLEIRPPAISGAAAAIGKRNVTLKPFASGADIQQALDAQGDQGGGTVRLPAGIFNFSGTLRIPAGVTLAGAGSGATVLQLVRESVARFARVSNSGWDQSPQGVHTAGDLMEYQIDVPVAGNWTVWLRYATDMSLGNQPGVSGNMTLAVDTGPAVSLMNLNNTGGFGVYRWAQSATLALGAGRHTLIWKNVKGGGIALDAFVFALNPAYVPALKPPPTNSVRVMVVQGEDCTRFVAKEGVLPHSDQAALWLGGDAAGVTDLAVLGNPEVNWGIAMCSAEWTVSLNECRVERVRVADCGGKQGQNCGLYVRKVNRAVVRDNELWGRAPLLMVGARQTQFARNRLVPMTRYGGNAEAAILGLGDTIEECLIEDNVVAAPPGAEAGGPTARRLIWLSTGHGSVTHNYLANNGAEAPHSPGAGPGTGQVHFGGVAGTDQNVGETILFEANHRTAYFGPLAAADARTATLPGTLPATPATRLGSVRREQLSHDLAGNETPFWPPDQDDGTDEPPVSEYYITVFSGRGQGQTRRVVRRKDTRLALDRAWTVAPQRGSVVVVGTGFYQNLIVGNHASDGMTGIQLWISCIENVISGNTIARQRRPGLYFYANGTTLSSSMPRTWNRGISPLFWNVAEGNRCDECSVGALITSGDDPGLPVEFPRVLGNVLRHNSFVRSRIEGVVLGGRRAAAGVQDASASVVGTIVEFNVVRDALSAFHAADSWDALVLRRNHAYFWYPVNNLSSPPTAFQLDESDRAVAIEKNSIENISGDRDPGITELRRPRGVERLAN